MNKLKLTTIALFVIVCTAFVMTDLVKQFINETDTQTKLTYIGAGAFFIFVAYKILPFVFGAIKAKKDDNKYPPFV